MYKLLVFDLNTWNYIIVSELLVLESKNDYVQLISIRLEYLRILKVIIIHRWSFVTRIHMTARKKRLISASNNLVRVGKP